MNFNKFKKSILNLINYTPPKDSYNFNLKQFYI